MEKKKVVCPHCGIPFFVSISDINIQTIIRNDSSVKKDVPDKKTLELAREAQ